MAFSRLRKNKLAITGLAIILFLVFVAVFAPLLAPHHPYEQVLERTLLAPSLEYPFGTDDFGRCIFSRVIYGTRLSLAIGVVVSRCCWNRIWNMARFSLVDDGDDHAYDIFWPFRADPPLVIRALEWYINVLFAWPVGGWATGSAGCIGEGEGFVSSKLWEPATLYHVQTPAAKYSLL